MFRQRLNVNNVRKYKQQHIDQMHIDPYLHIILYAEHYHVRRNVTQRTGLVTI